ncbi:hypothetical protein L208DRAFT_1536816 [Tricholoma matsutake]|nr:hypothetical protein L208DRAFT_1536816 [Tricholoma matsutake 945]
MAHDVTTSPKISVGRHPRTSLDYLRNQIEKVVCKDWHIWFAEPLYRGWHFLQLKGVRGKPVLPSTHKGGPWLKVMGNSTTDTSCATRMITGHAPIGEYRHCFSLDGEYQCWCFGPEIQTQDHILRVCPAADHKETHASPDTVEGIHEFLDNNPAIGSFTPLVWDPG